MKVWGDQMCFKFGCEKVCCKKDLVVLKALPGYSEPVVHSISNLVYAVQGKLVLNQC